MLGFGLVEFSCRFSGFGPNFMRIMRFDVKPKLERKQISPKSPMQIAQNKQPAKQKKEAKRNVQGAKKNRTTSGHHGWPVVTTTVRGGHHGQPVVKATAVVALRLPVVAVFRATLRFARRLMFDCCLFLALKMENVSGLKGVWVHRIACKTSLKPPLKKVEEEEGRRSQRRNRGGESRDRRFNKPKLSFYSLFFLLFSSI